MSLFGRETARLIRQDPWQILNLFAQEVYSLLCGDLPITQNAPVTITNGANGPALTINQAADNPFPAITINRGNGDVVNLGGSGGTGSIGGIDLGSIDFPGSNPATSGAATPAAADTPFTLYGVIREKVSGNLYKVECWAKPPAGNPSIGVLTVRQALCDPDETIPAGVPALVLCFPGAEGGRRTVIDAIMQVPVFLGDP